MQNTKNPLLSACIVLTVAVTLMSGWLTLKFFHGDGSTFESYVLGGIGVVLDSVKIIAPMIALYLWGRGNHVLAVLGGAFALLLCMISFVASVASLEKNVVKTQDSVEISQIDNQIKRHEALYAEHMAQYERRVAITYITDGDKSLMEAQKISEKIEQLTEEKKALAEGATVVKYGNQISVGASALIEIASIFLSVAMYYLRQDEKNALNPSEPQVNAASFSEEDRALILGLIGQVGNFKEEIETLKNAKVPETIEVAQASQVAMNAAEAIVNSDLQEKSVEVAPIREETISENVDVHKSDDVTESSNSNVVSPDFQKAIASSNSEEVETTKVHEESAEKSLGTDGDNGAKTILLSQKHKKIAEELRQKILDEEVEPSVRGVDSITTNRVLIRNTFEKMLADGELVRKGRGYALAA